MVSYGSTSSAAWGSEEAVDDVGPGKLRVLKIADQSRAESHSNLQNTHSQFRNSHFARAFIDMTN